MYQHLQKEHHYECIKSDFLKASTGDQQCFIARNSCNSQYLYCNYISLTFCYLEGNIFIALLASAFVGYLVYNCISEIIKEYLIPSLEAVKVKYEISEILAGVTILAFGNGAGDVITALVASSYPGGVDYNIGATQGAGFFLCSIGVYLIVKTAKGPIKLDPTILWRNIGFQIISIFVIMCFGVLGHISVFSALMLMFIYILLVSLVYFQEKSKILIKGKPMEERVETVEEAKYDLEKAQRFDNMNLIYFWDHKSPLEKTAKPQKWGTPMHRINYVKGDARVKLLTRKFQSAVQLTMATMDTKRKKWEGLTCLERVQFVLFYPMQITLKYTLPPCREEQFDKTVATIFPIPGSVFMTSVLFSFPPWWAYFIALIVGFACAIAINATVPGQKTPPKYFFYCQLFCVFGSMVWIFFVSGLLLDFLQFWQMITQLNKTYMGFSIVAMVNVLPDCITLVTLAENGYAIMALHGIYFGQLFTNLVGFSLAFLKSTLIHGPIQFQLFSIHEIETNSFKLMVILGSLANLLITLILAVKSHYILNKFTAEVLGTIYVVFFGIATLTAIYSAWKA